MKIVHKPVHEVRLLRKTSCEACMKSKNGAKYYFLRCMLGVAHLIRTLLCGFFFLRELIFADRGQSAKFAKIRTRKIFMLHDNICKQNRDDLRKRHLGCVRLGNPDLDFHGRTLDMYKQRQYALEFTQNHATFNTRKQFYSVYQTDQLSLFHRCFIALKLNAVHIF